MRTSAITALIMTSIIAGSGARAASLAEGAAAYGHLDFHAAREILMPLAAEGDPGAQAILGDMYLYGRGVPLNSFLAAKWYRSAAVRGEARAQQRLGQLYLRGRGINQDYDLAVRWFRAAADQGNPDAQFCLGSLYATGEGVERDVVAAHMWLSLAAINGTSDLAARDRDLVARRMSPAELSQAVRLAGEWRARPVSPPQDDRRAGGQ